ALLLTVNHCHFLNGNRICGETSKRLRLVSTSLVAVRVSRRKCAYSLPSETYRFDPKSGRSFRENVTRGQLPERTELVVSKKYSRWSAVALSEYVLQAPTRLPPNARWLRDVS